jgi:small-conductance mechanosensitive channel
MRGIRGASLIAVAITGFLLLAAEPGGAAQGVEGALPDTVAVIEPIAVEDIRSSDADAPAAGEPVAAAGEAAATLRDIGASLVDFLPRLGIALLVFLLAGLLVRLARPVLRRALRSFERAEAYTALVAIAIWLVALGVAFGVLAGDVRAVIGSLGLIGLALSWALQAPIESFTAWLLNSFRGYYRVGDRVAVGEVFGDVYRIDLLTTTVWEHGGRDRPGARVRAEQPTGRLITFPNSEVLTGTVVNYTRDFPYVWDELAFAVGDESDLRHAMAVLERVAVGTLGEAMLEPARTYGAILAAARLELEVPERPQVFLALEESYAEIVIRYLVPARERRIWKSRLSLAVTEEVRRDEHRGRILAAYPRRRVEVRRWESDDGGAGGEPVRHG